MPNSQTAVFKTACPGEQVKSARGPRRPPGPCPGQRYGPWLTLLILGAGCAPGEQDQAVVARVNGTPIVAQELDLALERKAAAGEPAQEPQEARRRLLQSLVIEELLAQQYRRTSPGSAQVDKSVANAVRREMLAHHFAAKLAAKVPPPSCAEIRAYYRDKPQLYARRQLFNLRRLEIPAPVPGSERELRARLVAAASLDEVVDWLRKADLRFVVSQTELGSNELPAELAGHLQRMQAGQVLVLPADPGVQIIQLVGARAAPLDEASAWPLIERRLWVEQQSAAVDAEIRKLAGMAAISILKEEPPPLVPERPPATAAKSEGGRPAAFPSCPAQPAEARRPGPNKRVEGLVQ